MTRVLWAVVGAAGAAAALIASPRTYRRLRETLPLDSGEPRAAGELPPHAPAGGPPPAPPPIAPDPVDVAAAPPGPAEPAPAPQTDEQAEALRAQIEEARTRVRERLERLDRPRHEGG